MRPSFQSKTACRVFVSLALLSFVVGCQPKPETALKNFPDLALADINNIDASFEQRRQWVINLKKHNRKRFNEDYGAILGASVFDGKEALQIAYLFFYSSGHICGYVETPIKHGDLWRCAVNLGFPPNQAKPILVDAKSGKVWQEGQTAKVDYIALIQAEDGQRK
jgi:hypothetical protein